MWSVTTCRLLQEGGGGDAGSRGHRDESLIPRSHQMPGLSSPVTGGSCLPSVQGGKRLQGLRFSCLPLEDGGHFSSKMQPGRKGPAGSPSGPALCVPAASQRPCRHPCPGPHSSAHPGVGASTQRPHPPPFCEEQIKGPSSPRRTLPGLGSKAARVPPAPDGARAAPVDKEGGFPLCGQVDGLCIVDSLICSPAHSLPIIHSAPHSHLHPLTTHCLPD